MKKKLKRWQRWVAGSLVALALLGGGYVTTRHYAWPAVKAHRLDTMNRDARAFLVSGDFANAILTARKSLKSTTVNPEAWRIAVEASKARAQPDAIYYQENLCHIEPTTENYLELMRLALQFSAINYAIDAIKVIGEGARENPEFHRLAAQAYVQSGQLLSAKFHLVALTQLQPADLTAQLDLVELELARDPAREDESARAKLRTLSEQPELRRRALTLLLRDHVTGNVSPGARKIVQELQSQSDLTLAERLLIIEGLFLVGSPDATAALTGLKAEAAAAPGDVARLVDFLVRSNRTATVMPWFATLPETTQANEYVQLQVAEALLRMRDYERLEVLLRGSKWPQRDYLRAALLAYSYRQQDRRADFAGAWKLALAGTAADMSKALALLARVDGWRWAQERHDVVWKIFALVPENQSVQEILVLWEKRQGNTVNLNRLFNRLVEVHPANEIARNNFAYTSLLLDANLARVNLLAADLAKTHPDNPNFATTYALALYKQGRVADALAQLDRLAPSEKSEPVRRVLRALCMATLGDVAGADDLVDGLASADFLPEEKKLLLGVHTAIAQSLRESGNRSRLLAMQQGPAGGVERPGWLLLLTPEARSTATPDMRLADTLYGAGNAVELRLFLNTQKWREHDYLRAALLAWASRQENDLRQSDQEWRQALASADRVPARLQDLRALTTQWEWRAEQIAVLNLLFEREAGNQVLLAELLDYYRSTRRTSELVRVLGVHLKDNSVTGDAAVAYAYYCLLIDSNLTRAHVVAQQQFAAMPTDRARRLVYAFSLWKQRRAAEALALLPEEKITLETEAVPAALLRAVILMELGNRDAARASLANFDPKAALPEEAELAEKISRQLLASTGAITLPRI